MALLSFPVSIQSFKIWGRTQNFDFFVLVDFWGQVTSGDTPYSSASTFEDLNLSPELLKGLYVEMKFQKPSKIQAISLPMILTSPYKDLIAQAHNGSGKTTCFVLGMLSRVDPNLKAPQALCICPTRELAIQVNFLFFFFLVNFIKMSALIFLFFIYLL